MRLHNAHLRVLPSTVKDLDAAWTYFDRPDLHKLSAVDAISFVLMTERRIRVAFAFDSHFARRDSGWWDDRRWTLESFTKAFGTRQTQKGIPPVLPSMKIPAAATVTMCARSAVGPPAGDLLLTRKDGAR
jgi:hypothetical protein